MLERASDNDQSPHKTPADNVKLLIALRRALTTHAKTPTHVRSIGVKNSHD
jgi:hypothetical protein